MASLDARPYSVYLVIFGLIQSHYILFGPFGLIQFLRSPSVLFDPFWSYLVHSALFGSIDPLRFCLVLFGPFDDVQSYLFLFSAFSHVTSYSVLFYSIWSCSILFSPVQHYSVLFGPLRFNSVLFGLVWSS